MTIDTTVIIDLLRENIRAQRYFENTGDKMMVSRVVVMEIIAGCKDIEEIRKNLRLLRELKLELLEVSDDISEVAGGLFETYFLSNGLGITDAFIAATALENGGKLVTHNIKHFKFIRGLELIIPY